MLHLFFFGHDLTILDKSETCKILKLFNLKEDKQILFTMFSATRFQLIL